MTKLFILAIALSFLGLFPLIGLPGACIVYMSKPIIDWIYGPLAYEAGMQKISSASWGLAIILTLLWPFIIPLSYSLINKIHSFHTLSIFTKSVIFFAVFTFNLFLLTLVITLSNGQFKKLSESELYETAGVLNRLDIIKKLDEQNVAASSLSIKDPFKSAILNKDLKMIEYFLASRKDFNTYKHLLANDNTGETPLHTATAKGLLELMKELLKRGANPDVKDSSDRTPAFYISWHTNHKGQELKILKDYAADFSLTDSAGDTPLISLTKTLNEFKNLEFYVDFLLKEGVDPNIKNEQGKTYLDYARENQHLE